MREHIGEQSTLVNGILRTESISERVSTFHQLFYQQTLNALCAADAEKEEYSSGINRVLSAQKLALPVGKHVMIKSITRSDM